MLNDLKHIAREHLLYIICSFVYFIIGGLLLGGTIRSFLIAFVFYFISVMLALSKTGEKLIRFLNGIRSLETNEEKDYLNPIFMDFNRFFRSIRKKDMERRLEICVIDKMYINACAVGKRTIAVTKGAIKAFSEEQLKGIIAHEVGHIYAYDTVASMFLFIGSGYFYLLTALVNLLIRLIDKAEGTTNNKSISVFSVIRTILKTLIFAFSFLIQLTLAIESRQREYEADIMAFRLRYGEELISALYLLEKISLGDNRNLKQKITASHPRTTARIERLEEYVKNYKNEQNKSSL